MLSFAKKLTGSDFSLYQIWRSFGLCLTLLFLVLPTSEYSSYNTYPKALNSLSMPQNQVRRVLNEFLTNRPSLIQDESVWKRLNLPEKV